MSRGAEQYNWAAYYEAAYEKERRQNIVLAEQIADAERRQADLRDNLERICATPFWKATVPFRRLHQNVGRRFQEHREKDRCSERNACLLRYAREVQRQKQPYQEWLREQGETDSEYIFVGDWQSVRVPETDVILLTYGGGALSAEVFGKIKSYFNDNQSCVIAYTDEDFYWEKPSRRMQPWLKPCYSPDTLLAYNYWGHLLAVREKLLLEVLTEEGGRGRFFPEENGAERKPSYLNGKPHEPPEQGRPEHEADQNPVGLDEEDGKRQEGEQEAVKQAVRFYNLCLCLEEAVMKECQLRGISVSDKICHIPELLFHQPYGPDTKTEELIAACGTEEERFLKAEQCLLRELEEGRYLTGTGS